MSKGGKIKAEETISCCLLIDILFTQLISLQFCYSPFSIPVLLLYLRFTFRLEYTIII